MVGVAMGEDYPIVIDNSQGTASKTTALDNSKHQSTEIDGDTTVDLLTATVAVTLNLNKVLGVGSNTPIFTIQGTNSRNSSGNSYCGVGIELYNNELYLDAWNTVEKYDNMHITLADTAIKEAACGVVVFTIKQNDESKKSVLSELLFLYDKEGKLINDKAYPGMGSLTMTTYFADFDQVNITSDLVYAAEVYGTVFEGEQQVYNLAESMMKGYLGESIPEPTTTTLSLLALAGLAARRHRK